MIPKVVRDLVDARAQGRCERCGRVLTSWYSRQHRIARGMGGTKRADTPANLVLLCGSATSAGCHRVCEDRDREAIDEGYVISIHSGADPAQVPILLWTGWTLLGHDGSATPWAVTA